MAHKQNHRGAHPNDVKNFHDRWIPSLRSAAEDLNYLLSKNYPERSTLQLVGNRYRLNKRQQQALRRVSLSDQQISLIQSKEIALSEIKDQTLYIDGFNLMISIEAALSGAFLFEGRDGCYRDIASVHSTYRRVEETESAFRLIGKSLQKWKPKTIHWYFDAPISNSGRLANFGRTISEESGFEWTIELVNNPDKSIANQSTGIALSCDTWVLENSKRWANLTRFIIDQHIPQAQIIRLYA